MKRRTIIIIAVIVIILIIIGVVYWYANGSVMMNQSIPGNSPHGPNVHPTGIIANTYNGGTGTFNG